MKNFITRALVAKKKIKLFFALFAMLALGVGNAWGAVYFEDNFSNVGNKDNQSISTRTGWETLTKCYSQGNSGLRIGSSSAAGSITKSQISDISGTKDIKVTVYVARYNTNANNFTVTTTNGTISSVSGVGTLSNGTLTISPTGNAGVTSTTSQAQWTDTYKTEFIITGASASTTIKFASNKRVILGPITIEDASSTDEPGSTEPAPSVTLDPSSQDFGTINVGETPSQEFTITTKNTTAELTASVDDNINYAVSAIVGDKVTVTYQPLSAGTHPAVLTVKAGEEATATVNLTGKAVQALEGTWILVTDASSLKAGDEIIIASKDANYALSTTQNTNNRGQVEITKTGNTITATTEAQVLTLQAGTKESTLALYTGAGYLHAASSSDNYLKTETNLSDNSSWTIAIANGTATLTAQGTNTRNKLYYNKSSKIFSCYSSAQQSITLYKKASSHTVTIASCTNGSVSAKMGETALATNDQVLSGTQITLSNTPKTGYKLAAYDVYKTGEAETKVTVTDGKFIMPEYDVTISATFELAKTLTSIEITTPATQTTFWQGEAFNHDGLKVTAHFDGAADEDVTANVTVEGSTATAGTPTVTVSFTEGTTPKTATYNITVKAIPNTKETAYTVADAFDIIDKLTTAEGVFISGIISQVDSYNSTYKSITYWISDDGTTTKQLQAYSGKGLESADFAAVTDLSVDDQVIVCGNLKKYSGTYEFDKNNYLAEHTKTTKADPELSYTTTEYNVNLGDEFTAPTLNNPHSLAVTYSSNNEEVATVAADGAVTIKAAGTVTITASFAGNESYIAGSASYNITINDPSLLKAMFVAGTDKSAELTISKNDVTVTFTDGTFNRDDNYRCYAGQKMTISYADGNIIKIVLAKSSDDNKTPSHFTTEQGTYTYAGTEGVWIGEAKSVTFETNTQVQMSTITVYYKQDTRANSELAWSEKSVSLTVGETFTAPTLNNPNSVADITYNTSDDQVATVTSEGVINLVEDAIGTATITATFAGDETYKPAEVTCTITVNPVTETVVILAEYAGQWYALKNEEQTAGKVLAALPVNYVGGKLYNVDEADKATIEWQRAAVTEGIIFKNGDNYISGTAGSADLKLSTTECAWTVDGTTYKLGNRTFFYNKTANGFKNYSISNAGNSGYSDLPVVTVPVYATSGVHTRTVPVGYYATVCLPNKIIKVVGATLFEVAGKEGNKVIFDEVITPEAGMPYIFLAEENTISFYYENGTEAEAGYSNSLHGTFSVLQDAQLDGMYMVQNNKIVKCAATGCTIPANRAYFDGTELDALGTAPAPMPGRRRITMGAESENTATGVEGIIAPEGQTIKVISNGQLIIIRDGVKYNAQGQQL